MTSIEVYWRRPALEHVHGARSEMETSAVTGRLTDEDDAAPDEAPVLIDEASGRTYGPADLPDGTVVYVEAPPGELPEIAQAAQRAGFTVRHA